jgi:putative ABC transport system permease protein
MLLRRFVALQKKPGTLFRYNRSVPLKNIHLYFNSRYELEVNGNIRYVHIFGALAIFILVLAWINFTNPQAWGDEPKNVL